MTPVHRCAAWSFSPAYGARTSVEEGNLDTYIHFLRKRLSHVGSTVSIATMRGIGYLMKETTEE